MTVIMTLKAGPRDGPGSGIINSDPTCVHICNGRQPEPDWCSETARRKLSSACGYSLD